MEYDAKLGLVKKKKYYKLQPEWVDGDGDEFYSQEIKDSFGNNRTKIIKNVWSKARPSRVEREQDAIGPMDLLGMEPEYVTKILKSLDESQAKKNVA